MTMAAAFRLLFISRFIAATAATHGVYNRVNTKKLAAETPVNMVPNILLKLAVEVPVKTLKVLTTASLAVNPVIKAVDTLQSEKPNGAKIGAIILPTNANRLFPLSSTTFNLVSKVCKNQMMIVATKIMVNALWMKSFALSHIKRITLLADGKR